MNSLHLSGSVQGDPQSNEHNGILAASITLIFAAESTVTVLALGALAQELCGFQNGDGIIVRGRLTGKHGKLEFLADHVATHKKAIYERRLPPTVIERREVTLTRKLGKAAKKHW